MSDPQQSGLACASCESLIAKTLLNQPHETATLVRSTTMSKNRIFKETPKTRLIVSVETETVAAIDRLIRYPSANRSEFVRLAIEEKLERDVVLFQNRVSAVP